MSPIKPNLRTEIIPILLIIISIVASFYFYSVLPDQVATHWNFEGQVDDYSSKAVGAFLLPGIMILMYLMFLGLPYIDPKRKRYGEFANVYHIFKGILIGFMFIIYLATSFANLGYNIDIGVVIPALVGILFIIMGNYMGKIKHNWFMGIRTPWTLSSENVWNKTHRVGGWLFILLGIIMLLMPIMPKEIIAPIFIAAIVAVTVGTFGYSYFLYRNENKK